MKEMPFEELIEGLLRNRESEYIEFKQSNDEASYIGTYISALSNGAVLADKEEAYLIYGVDDSGKIVGTKFDPYKKYHNQPIINYLATNLKHSDQITYRVGEIEHKKIVVIIIPRAKIYPVEFNNTAYVRIDSSKKQLHEHPEVARTLWEKILRRSFEDGYATNLLSAEEVFRLLDFSPYYSRREVAYPENRALMIDSMLNEGVLVEKLGKYYITNLGAIMFAKNMSNFPSLTSRSVRVIKYSGNNKIKVEKSVEFAAGYALEIDRIYDIVDALLPGEEYIEKTVRKERIVFPKDIIRELIPNELIHQDLFIEGYNPRIEIYSDRIEFSNSGEPVIDTQRFLDLNRSRNTKLARLARFLKICEERGMGIDKVETACELACLPSPVVSAGDGITRVIVFGHKTLRMYSKENRTNLVYMHCCLRYISHEHLTNESLRGRFPEGLLSPTVASRWIKEAVSAGTIFQFDPSTSKKNTSYIPFWAR